MLLINTFCPGCDFCSFCIFAIEDDGMAVAFILEKSRLPYAASHRLEMLQLLTSRDIRHVCNQQRELTA